jgi:hypothetical protein
MPGDVELYTQSFPVMYDKSPSNMVEEVIGENNFLGLTDSSEVKKDEWQSEVRDLKKRLKND